MVVGRPSARWVASLWFLAVSLHPGGSGQAREAGGHPMHGDSHHESDAAGKTVVELSSDPASPRPDEETTLTFRFTDKATGNPVSDLVVTHDRILHVLIVRHDLARFLHLHPEDSGPVSPGRAASGTLSVKARFPEPGRYRVVADFTRKGGNLVKAFDLRVEGDASAEPVSPESPRTRTFGGYRVTLSSKHSPLHAEDTMTLWYDIRGGDGRPVDLEDHLGAKMHVVTWSYGELRYVHAHPEGSARKGQQVRLVFPEKGRYRIFGQFRAKGSVVTTDFVVDVVEHPPHKLPGE